VVPRLRDAGHDIAVSAFWGLQGGIIEYDGVRQYPAGFAPYGNDVIPLHARDFRADIVIALIDIWVYGPELFKQCRVVPWSPVDHHPVPGPVLERFQRSFRVFAYSKFAVRALEEVGFTNVDYVPLGVETNEFKPMNKEECRREFGIPNDLFVFGMVAANQTQFPTRKGFERAMAAFASLRRKYRDTLLYIHSYIGTELGGVPLAKLAEVFQIPDHCMFSNPDIWRVGGLSRDQLARLYNCFDVLIAPSSAEGFCIPLIEAQACGVPVITSNFTSCPELCASGWLVEPATLLMTPMLSFQAAVSIKELEARMLFAIENPGILAEEKRKAREFALSYDWDKVMAEYFLPAISNLEAKIRGPQNLLESVEYAKVTAGGLISGGRNQQHSRAGQGDDTGAT